MSQEKEIIIDKTDVSECAHLKTTKNIYTSSELNYCFKPNKIKTINRKPNDRLKLIILPPKKQEEITPEDIKNFYKNLTSVLISEL